MADKPKTYPQQIQELKQKLEDALTDAADANRRASFIPELQEEIDELKHQALQRESFIVPDNKAQLTDLQQQIDSNAQLARTAQESNRKLTVQNQELLSRLQSLADIEQQLAIKDSHIEKLKQELSNLTLLISQIKQRAKEQISEADNQVAATSRELKDLRLRIQSYSNQYAELKEYAGNQIDTLTRENAELNEQLQKLNERYESVMKMLNRYRELVDEIPDTKAELLAILRPLNGPSTE